MIPPLGGYNLALILTLTIAIRDLFLFYMQCQIFKFLYSKPLLKYVSFGHVLGAYLGPSFLYPNRVSIRTGFQPLPQLLLHAGDSANLTLSFRTFWWFSLHRVLYCSHMFSYFCIHIQIITCLLVLWLRVFSTLISWFYSRQILSKISWNVM